MSTQQEDSEPSTVTGKHCLVRWWERSKVPHFDLRFLVFAPLEAMEKIAANTAHPLWAFRPAVP